MVSEVRVSTVQYHSAQLVYKSNAHRLTRNVLCIYFEVCVVQYDVECAQVGTKCAMHICIVLSFLYCTCNISLFKLWQCSDKVIIELAAVILRPAHVRYIATTNTHCTIIDVRKYMISLATI
jgi:hypothetical protein